MAKTGESALKYALFRACAFPRWHILRQAQDEERVERETEKGGTELVCTQPRKGLHPQLVEGGRGWMKETLSALADAIVTGPVHLPERRKLPGRGRSRAIP